MEFSQTERGKRLVIKDGYQYVLQKVLANNDKSYECILRRKGECKAKIKLTAEDVFSEELNEHTHPPSQTNVEVRKVKASVKERANNCNDTSQQILGDKLQDVSEAAAVNLPAINNMRRNIRRQRQEHNVQPIPQRREEIPVLPNGYQITNRGDRFLLHDSGVGDVNRIIVFATDDAIQLLGTSNHWFMDGTFKLCPEIFFQIYTVHALINNKTFPCVFALLPNKTEATYNRLMIEILNAVRDVGNDPDDILVDFERASINAVKNQINQIEVGSLFIRFFFLLTSRF